MAMGMAIDGVLREQGAAFPAMRTEGCLNPREEMMMAAVSAPWWTFSAIALVVALRLWFFTAIVSSDSMKPAFGPRSLVLARRLHRGGAIERGDVLIFHSREMGMTMIKRVIGLPNDHIEFRPDGSTLVNDMVLDEPYAVSPGAYRGRFHVPVGHYFFLGDNRERSEDSRSWESPYIPFNDLNGKVVFGFPSHRKSAPITTARVDRQGGLG